VVRDVECHSSVQSRSRPRDGTLPEDVVPVHVAVGALGPEHEVGQVEVLDVQAFGQVGFECQRSANGFLEPGTGDDPDLGVHRGSAHERPARARLGSLAGAALVGTEQYAQVGPRTVAQLRTCAAPRAARVRSRSRSSDGLALRAATCSAQYATDSCIRASHASGRRACPSRAARVARK
jgi:hypothetical protein